MDDGEQMVLLDDAGEALALPNEKQKMKPRGLAYNLENYRNSIYPDFAKKVREIGHSIQGHTVEEMKRGLFLYYQLCDQYNLPIRNQLAYEAMGIDRRDAYDFANGRRGNDEIKELILQVKKDCAMYRQVLHDCGATSPITYIWEQKAYDGMSEDAEAMASMSSSIENTFDSSTDELINKYSDLPD